jgi:hypothetical protein
VYGVRRGEVEVVSARHFDLLAGLRVFRVKRWRFGFDTANPKLHVLHNAVHHADLIRRTSLRRTEGSEKYSHSAIVYKAQPDPLRGLVVGKLNPFTYMIEAQIDVWTIFVNDKAGQWGCLIGRLAPR